MAVMQNLRQKGENKRIWAKLEGDAKIPKLVMKQLSSQLDETQREVEARAKFFLRKPRNSASEYFESCENSKPRIECKVQAVVF